MTSAKKNMEKSTALFGNGFDLYNKLPTSYYDFLTVCNYLKRKYERRTINLNESTRLIDILNSASAKNPNSNLSLCVKNHEKAISKICIPNQTINDILELVNPNDWIELFTKSASESAGWIDFENNTAGIISELKKDLQKQRPGHSPSSRSMLINFKCLLENGQIKSEFLSNSKKYDNQKMIERLYEEYGRLNQALKLYLSKFVNPILDYEYTSIPKKTLFSDIQNIFTYNYTKTAEKMFLCESKVIHINGSIDDVQILGVAPDSDDDEGTENTDFICFKKYYQKLMSDVSSNFSNEYRLLRPFSDDKTKNGVLKVIGHSLDTSDKDTLLVIFDCFDEIIIYYHDKKAKDQYIKNLVKMYGHSKLQNMINTNVISFVHLGSVCLYSNTII